MQLVVVICFSRFDLVLSRIPPRLRAVIRRHLAPPAVKQLFHIAVVHDPHRLAPIAFVFLFVPRDRYGGRIALCAIFFDGKGNILLLIPSIVHAADCLSCAEIPHRGRIDRRIDAALFDDLPRGLDAHRIGGILHVGVKLDMQVFSHPLAVDER